MNYAQFFSSHEAKLEMVGEDKENLIYVFRELKDWSQLDFILHQNQEVLPEDKHLLNEIFEQLKNHRSPQYITGHAYFRNLILTVDPHVLIPRPETEELVDLILSENSKASLAILDIGTGSGAIAISLKQTRPDWIVTASDISVKALQLATKNARDYDLDITFIESDIFSSILGKFDIIVSNPPYIAYKDKSEVGTNVLVSEPHLALFADEDGFAIYRRIIEGAQQRLTQNGKLYFEIGYKQGDTLRTFLTQQFPQKRIRVLKDGFGKDRMVVVDNG